MQRHSWQPWFAVVVAAPASAVGSENASGESPFKKIKLEAGGGQQTEDELKEGEGDGGTDGDKEVGGKIEEFEKLLRGTKAAKDRMAKELDKVPHIIAK